jgi:tripartite-type tricarboxylate transporter receptor subunit TctC
VLCDNRGVEHRVGTDVIRICVQVVVAVCCLISQAVVHGADAFPTKPIRIVVPFAAGGSTDILARNIAQRLNEVLRSPVIVDNRAGGAGVRARRRPRRQVGAGWIHAADGDEHHRRGGTASLQQAAL